MVDFAQPVDHRMKINDKKKLDKYLDLTGEHGGDGDINGNLCNWNYSQRLVKVAGGVRNQRTSAHHTNYSIVEVGQNTERCPGDLGKLHVTQISVTDHQLTLV